ncbi:MAG: hypothetical protein AB7L66_12255 [Gemmatimonadales bacterium]
MTHRLSTLIFAGLGIAAFSCSDSSGPTGGTRVGLMVSTAASGIVGAAAESVVVGGHTLTIDKVELVLREIELKRVAGSADCSFDPAAAASSDGDHHGDRRHNDECSELEIGPLLLDLPLGGGPERALSVEIDSGTYRKIEFKIHKAGSDSGDRAFLAEHPEFAGISVRVQGTYDGEAFSWEDKVTAKQEAALDPPLVVAENTTTDLTLVVEVGSWFLAGGVGIIDPKLAMNNGPYEATVRNNIRRSFRIFEDRDRDGRKDH